MRAPTNRTLVFSFDGTGNEPGDAHAFEQDESISNILKLHVLMGGGLAEDRTPTETRGGDPQLTYYYNGIGTREGGVELPLVGRLIARATGLINQALAPTWGDARHILDEAVNDLREIRPTPADRIVVFGFSRGAALARKFASIALQEYDGLRIAFLGAFDTVGTVDGIHPESERAGSDVEFENGTVHDRVEQAVHLLSLDEDRVAFEPTLMNRDASNPARITEVWFPGVHGDVGGGYWLDGLADVALSYMIDRCRECLGKHINIEASRAAKIRDLLTGQGEILELLDADDIIINPDVTGMAHVHTAGFATLYARQVRKVCVWESDQPLSTSQCRPLVHHSAKARFDLVPDYRPPALRGLHFELLLPRGRRRDVDGIAGLREVRDRRSRNSKRAG